ncbi:leucyl/phenylalanyl-tRNA--protein transferase [Enterovibrio norvegicus]|uniref:leucyl/phenylalanyl-tRNA--protein transferase n=1 Tax=Enterovibrio norvegicus TaxID=188144 RepID=UPI0002E2C73B|nr:leucyl/phenylalanyl-tRNA--protein transferase [Enterovibrio norvegicus]OEE43034.1 leucyl/phenylalanyl-tRNA--protein transferase [Enterovibrio norvegicus]
MTIYLPPLDDNKPEHFPPISSALDDPDGLLAIGGDLSPRRLASAYHQGIFPWFGVDEPILWWSPSERAVIHPTRFSPQKSLRKFVRKNGYRVSINHRFDDVIQYCALIRGEDMVWITPEMRSAYKALHRQGSAHSVEVWQGDELVGGLYGVSVGAMFCGESMFSLKPNASKTALWFFCEHFRRHGGLWVDCQMMTEHLASMGAQAISRDAFLTELEALKKVKLDESVYTPQCLGVQDD